MKRKATETGGSPKSSEISYNVNYKISNNQNTMEYIIKLF